MIKMIAFDCWGTLFGNSRRPHPFEEFAQALGHTLKDRNFLRVFEQTLMADDYPDLKVPIRQVLDHYEVPPDPALLDKLEQVILNSTNTQVAFPETLETLAELSKNYRLGLISNTHRQGFEGLTGQFEFLHYFDVILTSYEQKIVKPDRRIFYELLQTSGCDAAEVAYVGDSLTSDIIPTKALGITPILIDRPNRFPGITEKITDLREIQAWLRG